MGGRNGLENGRGGMKMRGKPKYDSKGFLMGYETFYTEPIRLPTMEEHVARLEREAGERVKQQAVVRKKPVYLPR